MFTAEYCTTHPWHSVFCAWASPCTSPYLLRGDTALSLLASCTHLMFLCRFSCGLVLSKARILFDSPGKPGSHPPQEMWFCFEAGRLVENRIRQIEKRNLGRRILVGARFITHRLHCIVRIIAISERTSYVRYVRSRPDHAPAQPGLSGTVVRLCTRSLLGPLPSR